METSRVVDVEPRNLVLNSMPFMLRATCSFAGIRSLRALYIEV